MQTAKGGQREDGGLFRVVEGNTAFGKCRRDVPVIDLRRFDRAFLLRIIRKGVASFVVFNDKRGAANLKRVDAAAGFFADNSVDADDLGNEGTLEFSSESTLWSGGVPNAEHQGGRAKFVERGRVLQAHVVEFFANLGLTKRLTVQQAVAEDGVSDAVRSLKAGDSADGVEEVFVGEINLHYRNGCGFEATGVDGSLKGILQAVGLSLNGIQEDAWRGLECAVGLLDAAIFGGVGSFVVGRREDFRSVTGGGLKRAARAKSSGGTANGRLEGGVVEFVAHGSGWVGWTLIYGVKTTAAVLPRPVGMEISCDWQGVPAVSHSASARQDCSPQAKRCW